MGWLHVGLLENLIRWLRDYDTILYAPSGLRPIPYARNACVKAFLGSGCSHIWFVDADTVPPRDALDKLLSADLDAVSGIVNQVKRDADGIDKAVGVVVRRNENGELKAAVGTQLERITACGSGCIMLKREVFEKLEFPWYQERAWGAVRGSDFILGEKLEAIGIPLHAHFDVMCTHRKEVEF